MDRKRDEYIQHIQDHDKKMEMRKIMDKIHMVMNNHMVETTDFLDPYERKLAISLLNRFTDISYHQGSLNDSFERDIFAIYPHYFNKADVEMNIMALRILGDLTGLSHRNFLGSVLSLGINRSKIGDILICEDSVDIIVKEEIGDFILFNLEKVSNRNVNVVHIPIEDIKYPEIKYKEIITTLPSLRLDAIISGAYNLSRQESLNIIKRGKVKVNWEPIDKSSKELESGDIISIPGYGRCILDTIKGTTRKGRLRSKIKILL